MESQVRIDRYRDRFPDNRIRVEPVLGAMVTRMDEGVGRLLGALKTTGLEDNTLVLFCSDNGGKHSYADQHPFRKGKGWLYEGGIRVPLIVRVGTDLPPAKNHSLSLSMYPPTVA